MLPERDVLGTGPIDQSRAHHEAASLVDKIRGAGQVLRTPHLAAIYAAVITCAELLTTYADPILGSLLHLIVFGAVIVHGALERRPRAAALWLTLSLVPLIRIISLGLPLGAVSVEWWYVLAGLPLLAGAITAARSLGFTRQQIGIRLPQGAGWLLTFLVVASGLIIGMTESSLIGPAVSTDATTLTEIMFFVSVLIIGTGFIEELIFRGVLHAAAVAAMGTIPGIVFVSVLFAVMHTGHGSLLNVLFLFMISILFGFVRQMTGSLLGVILAHSLANLVLLVILA